MPGTNATGVVEKVEFTQHGMGNQWTTIDGVRYCTFWDFRTRDWREGDTVNFEDVTAPVFSNTPTVRQARNIHKAAAPRSSMTLEQFKATKEPVPGELPPHRTISVDYLGGACSIAVVVPGYLLQLNNEVHRSEDLEHLEGLLYVWALENLPELMLV